MAIGQRIKYFRNRKGMTQKQLGEQLGFKGKTSDVRMAQYESEARVPKIDLVKQMSQIFDINTHALTVPDIDTHIGLMHTLFALEDMYGIKIEEIDGELCLRLDRGTKNISTCSNLFMHGSKWLQNWKPEKSARKNTIPSDITIRNWTPPRFGQKFRLRNSLTNSSRH